MKNILWPTKTFQKRFMAHQCMLKTFHDFFKNPPAPPPTYLMYGPLATLEERINTILKENEHLKIEIESSQKVTQLPATEASNKIYKSVWKTVSNKNQRIRNTNLDNEIGHLAMLLNNI